MKPLPRLYAIADASFGDPIQLAEALFNGGAQLVQVRNKNASARDLLRQVERILELAPNGAQVIVNDRIDVALVAGAAGVHLGQTDLAPAAGRQILGSNRIVGFSTHNLAQALEADKLPTDYVAVGPVFATTTKSDPDPIVGLKTLAEICKAIRKPVVAIGGIRLENAVDVMSAGASSIAVIRGLFTGVDVTTRTREWIKELEK